MSLRQRIGLVAAGVTTLGALSLMTVSGEQVVTPAGATSTTPAPGRQWPTVETTGVPDGVTLTPYTGPLSITDPGATVIDAREIGTPGQPVTLTIEQSAGTVDITRSRIWGEVHIWCSPQSTGAGAALVHCPGPTPFLTMTDSEVQQQQAQGDAGVGYENFHLTRVEINGGRRSFNCETDATVEDSLMHGIADDPTGMQHQSTGRMSQGCTLIGNVFECAANDYPPDAGCSADLTGYGDFETVADNLVQGNLFKATKGGFCAYGGSSASKPYANAHDIRFVDNVFERRPDTGRCGFYGTVSDFDASAPGNVWSGNVWADDGTPVPSGG